MICMDSEQGTGNRWLGLGARLEFCGKERMPVGCLDSQGLKIRSWGTCDPFNLSLKRNNRGPGGPRDSRSGDRRYFIAQETGATLSRRRPALLYRSGDRRYFIGQETGATLSRRRPALQCCAWRVSEGCGGLERFHRAASRVCAARVRAAVSTSNCWAASCESRASMASLTPGMTTAE